MLAAVQEGCEAVGIEVTNAYYELGHGAIEKCLAAHRNRRVNPSRNSHDSKNA